MLTKKKKITIFISYVIIGLFVFTTFPQYTTGKYNVKVGDNFNFYINRFRALNNSAITASLGAVTFRENVTMKVEFSIVDPPLLKTKLTIEGFSTATIFFVGILVKNRTWDKLAIEYQEFGYEIVEDKDYWGFQVFNSSLIINATYWKHDGVLVHIYAYNHPLLVSTLEIGEFEFIRTSELTKSVKWPYAFLALIPISGVVIGVILYQRKKVSTAK